ncbi:TonB-dependent receptor plug domain-containing protein [Noviherbaspirillum aridicola]|uniref:Ligand-gated channel protein n=1 Tax=Noviherbaspirillum aridicola TaxID=2849687 RepID=A0ABQ4Q7U1_9BURK|nr:TonB-dependent receptor [Noviherbaspirillum aridicola]GIZ53265.1 ligand-gated channel protein [Noviherbaspirillum aridicola]
MRTTTGTRLARDTLRRLAGAAGVAAVLCGQAAARTDVAELADMPIEQLLAFDVYSASRFSQKPTEAPSNVSVVTAADIRAFGWRTLADILGSMRGLHTSYDRNYSYLGARGFLRPGDFNTRFLLLVDGNRVNDGVYEQAALGTEFGVDVDLIERVEFVPGPGSSIYGTNAFLGVVNVITKRGRDLAGPRVALEAGSQHWRRGRASYGKRGDGHEWLLSVSSFRERGKDVYFPEFDTPETSNGVASGLDHDRGRKLFFRGSAGDLSLSLLHGERTKGVPTASYEQAFNDPRSRTVDTQTAIDVGWKHALSSATELNTRVHWGRYQYRGDYAYLPAPEGLNRDRTDSAWWGMEARLVTVAFDGHKLVAGAEYQRDYRREQINYDLDPYLLRLDARRTGYRGGVYAQDEIRLRENLLLNAGMRIDRNDISGTETSPRLALIHRPAKATTLKLMHGHAFRAPSAYEAYYSVPGEGGQKPNPSLKVEHMRSTEVSVEQSFRADTRLLLSVYRNRVSDLITQVLDPADGLLMYDNIDRARSQGAEVEFEQVWTGGARLRVSYSRQHTRDLSTGMTLPNSPRHLAKLNLAAPLLGGPWQAGVELRYTSRRNTLAGSTGSHLLTNLTLSSLKLAPGLDVSASLYNLFDRRWSDPGGGEHRQDALRQNGRSVRLKMEYAF